MTNHSGPAKLLRLPQVLPFYGTAKTQLHNDIKDGLMTRPVKLSSRLALWPEHELAAVNSARIAGKSPDEIRALVRQLHAQRQIGGPVVAAGA